MILSELTVNKENVEGNQCKSRYSSMDPITMFQRWKTFFDGSFISIRDLTGLSVYRSNLLYNYIGKKISFFFFLMNIKKSTKYLIVF